MIYGRNLFDQAIRKNIKAYEGITKLSIGHGNDYTTECLLRYL